MDAKQAIESSMNAGLTVLNKYAGDLDDADLMERPGPGCNCLAWQLGHLIASESFLVNLVCPGQGAALPEGFAEKHGKDQCDVEDRAHFLTRDEYLKLYDEVRVATKKALAELPAERLDEPAPERFRSVFPTVGSVFLLIANHPMMHAGQFVPVRRRKGKPVVI